jgi:hypothetical protein
MQEILNIARDMQEKISMQEKTRYSSRRKDKLL